MASRTKLLTELSVADLWKTVKDPEQIWGDLSIEMKRTVKLLLQNRLHDELAAYLRAERYEHVPGRRGVRNGAYRRCITTTYGTIPDLEMPRTRLHGFSSATLPRYQRRMAAVDRLIRDVFLAGISTRRVGSTLAQLLEDTISPSTVSSITRLLDQQVEAWHRRPWSIPISPSLRCIGGSTLCSTERRYCSSGRKSTSIAGARRGG
jgi:transposase-like protein